MLPFWRWNQKLKVDPAAANAFFEPDPLRIGLFFCLPTGNWRMPR